MLFNTFSDPGFRAWHYNLPLFSNPADLILSQIVGFDLRKCVSDPLLTVTTFLCSAINSLSQLRCASESKQDRRILKILVSRQLYLSLSLSCLLALRISTMLYNVCTMYKLYIRTWVFNLRNRFKIFSFYSSADSLINIIQRSYSMICSDRHADLKCLCSTSRR